jgi:hypothetical protein
MTGKQKNNKACELHAKKPEYHHHDVLQRLAGKEHHEELLLSGHRTLPRSTLQPPFFGL